jgi:hypothetical protein
LGAGGLITAHASMSLAIIGLAPADPQTDRGLPFPPKFQPKRSDSRFWLSNQGLYGLHFSLAFLLISA